MAPHSPEAWPTIRILAVSALESRPLAETLLGLDRIGLDLEVIAPGHTPYAALLRDADCALLSTYPGLDHRSALLTRERLRIGPVDILYVEGLGSPASIVLAACGLPARVVVRLCYLESNRRLPMPNRLVCRSPKVARVISDVDPAAAGDPLAARWLAHKTQILPSAHDPDWYPSTLDLTTFGIPAGAFSVVAASDGPGQDMEWVIGAARELPMDLPIHFLLLAPESTHERLRRLIRKSPFTQRFHLSDAIDTAPGVSSSCSVFVVTDWDVEIQRRASMQCLACGVPVVAPNVAPLDQIVRSGVSGELLPGGNTQALAQSLFELYEHPERRALLGAGAKRVAEERPSVEAVVAETAAIFERILAET